MLSKQNIKDLMATTLVKFYKDVMVGKIAEDIATHNAIEATAGQAGHMTTDQVTKLEGIAEGAEVNQNAIANVKVGTVTIAAGAEQDTVEFVAGSNVTVTANKDTKKVTIAGNYGNFGRDAAGLVPAYTSDTANMFLGTTGWKTIQAADTSTAGVVTLVDGITSDSTVAAATAASVKAAVAEAKSYADGIKSAIMGAADVDTRLDTIKELADLLKTDDGGIVGNVSTALAGKADADHTHKGEDLTLGTYTTAGVTGTISATDSVSTALAKLDNKIAGVTGGGTSKLDHTVTLKTTGAATGQVTTNFQGDEVVIDLTLADIASNQVASMTGYTKPANTAGIRPGTTAAIATSDSLNEAIGKLEAGLKGLTLGSLHGTASNATLANYGITDAYSLTDGNALAARVTTLEQVHEFNEADSTAIIDAVKAGIAPPVA